MISEDPGRDDLRWFQTHMVPDAPNSIWGLAFGSLVFRCRHTCVQNTVPNNLLCFWFQRALCHRMVPWKLLVSSCHHALCQTPVPGKLLFFIVSARTLSENGSWIFVVFPLSATIKQMQESVVVLVSARTLPGNGFQNIVAFFVTGRTLPKHVFQKFGPRCLDDRMWGRLANAIAALERRGSNFACL